jgi:O-methyltransferase/methyltransferase family protein
VPRFDRPYALWVNRAVDAGQTTTDGAGADATAAPRRLARLIDGYLTTQLLYVAARLGVADVLADGPRTGLEVAEAVGADPDALTRMLRGLVLEDVLEQDAGGRFALTAVGERLREGVPGSQRGAVLVRGEVYWSAGAGMLRTATEGGTAFEHVHGERFFEHLAADPEREAAFHASMADRARREAADVVAVHDFAGLRELVDVGGGSGVLLEAILRATPGLRGVLVDRPEAVELARRRLAAAGLEDRCQCLTGDFFAEVPPGADAYLLSRVIHDWDDADARRVLATCRAAMSGNARLLLVEAIVPERPHDAPEAIRMDLHMLMLLRARERTEAQFRDLLADAGFDLRRVVPTGSAAGLSVLEATVASAAR